MNHAPFPSRATAAGARVRPASGGLVRRSLAAAALLAAASTAGPLACGGGGGDGGTAPGGAVADVVVDPAAFTIMVGSTRRLGAVLHDAGGTVLRNRQIVWQSSDAGVASVDQDGVVTAVKSGTAKIAASAEGKAGYSDVVVAPGGPATIAVDPPSATLLVAQTAQFTATVRDASGEVLGGTVAWSSDNSGVAKVSSTGVVTGVSPGTTTIVASREGVRGTASVTVQLVPVSRVVVSPATASVKRGATKQFTATAYDAAGNRLTGRSVQWTTSDANIATVSSTGVVKGVKAGTATITATVDGKSGTATVTVN
ncbi:MAG TPA: Ig-like domain-containing protein [Gemmatimonadaceae bacterium]|nr:Ig-like domain-containing protein [Gemmatimonadaceae bacterium]